jgi:REP element-mobilizing transposase RayT
MAPGLEKRSDCFGGQLLKNSNAKRARPLESKLPLHLVLKARRSVLRLPRFHARVNELVRSTSRHHGVKLYEYANAGNHLHLVIKIRSVRSWSSYIRELTGRLAQFIEGHAKLRESFWLHRPFTRIVRGWRRAFATVRQYVDLNNLEAEGFISRKNIKTLRDLRLVWGDW